MGDPIYAPPPYPPSQSTPSPYYPSTHGMDPPMAPENLEWRPPRPTPQPLSAARRLQLTGTNPTNLEPRYAMAMRTEPPPVPEARIPQPTPQPLSETWRLQPSMPPANLELRYAMAMHTEPPPVPEAWMHTEPPPAPEAQDLDPWLSYWTAPQPQGTFTPQHELQLPSAIQPGPQSLSDGQMQQHAGPSTQYTGPASTQRPNIELSNLSDIQVLNLRQSLTRSNFLVRPISNHLHIL